MEVPAHLSFENLAEQRLGPGFPPHLSGRLSLADLPPEAREFTLRLLKLMKRSGCDITQINGSLLGWLRFTIPDILSGTWEGRIPPITVAGRHRKLDDYLAGHPLARSKNRPVFLDIGCGFPPVTTRDTARRFPHWQVVGADRCFADYLVMDSRGHYACFDRQKNFLYLHPAMTISRPRLAGHLDQAGLGAGLATLKQELCRLFEELLPLLGQKLLEPMDTGTPAVVEKEGSRLIYRQILEFETENLTFIESDLAGLDSIPATFLRCMNLFVYFPKSRQKKMLNQINRLLAQGGIALIGTNSFGIQTRYAVYQKHKGSLVPEEFAFSLDNLGHLAIIPWFCLHDRDPEALLLADLAATLRRAAGFWKRFSKDLDRLMKEAGLCCRQQDGFLHGPKKEIPPRTILDLNYRIWKTMEEKGHAVRAVETLEKAGIRAWLNPAGDIAVRPRQDALW